MNLVKEICDFVVELKNNFFISNIIKNVPEFSNKVSDFFTVNTIEQIREKILSRTTDPESKLRKEQVLDFIVAIWPDVPNTLKLKLVILLYSSYVLTHELYMFIVANGLIITERFTNKQFDLDIRKHIVPQLNG